MCPGNLGRKANGNSAQAVALKTMLAGFPGQEVNSNGAQAVGFIETVFSFLAGQQVNVVVHRLWAL